MLGNILHRLQERIQRWTKPATLSLIPGLLSDLTRNRTDLIVENAMSRQQRIVLNRQIKRPQLTNPDRFRLVLLSHLAKFWKQSVDIVQPDALSHWQRELFRLYWRRTSQSKLEASSETIALIQKMTKERKSRLSSRIVPMPLRETWATFLKNQARDICACDFTVAYDGLFRAWYIFVLIDL